MRFSLTRPWTHEEWAHWLDEEVRVIAFWQNVVLVATAAMLFCARGALAMPTLYDRLGAVTLGLIAAGLWLVALLFAADRRCAIPHVPFGTLLLHKAAGWSTIGAATIAGIWYVNPLPPLFAVAAVYAFSRLLPCHWWRGVEPHT